MRRFIGVVLGALLLAGCAGDQILGGRIHVLDPVVNPVTRTTLAQVESAYGVVLSAAVAYRRLGICPRNVTISVTRVCADRNVILQLQAADRNAQTAIRAARTFVRNYPTLDPIQMVRAASEAVSAFQQVAAANGVR